MTEPNDARVHVTDADLREAARGEAPVGQEGVRPRVPRELGPDPRLSSQTHGLHGDQLRAVAGEVSGGHQRDRERLGGSKDFTGQRTGVKSYVLQKQGAVFADRVGAPSQSAKTRVVCCRTLS